MNASHFENYTEEKSEIKSLSTSDLKKISILC